MKAKWLNCFLFQSRWRISWKKTLFGILVLILVTCLWVGATQYLKDTYKVRQSNISMNSSSTNCDEKEVQQSFQPYKLKNFSFQFVAPFFSCWFCTGWTSLFFPLYFVIKTLTCKKYHSFNNSINYQHLNFSKCSSAKNYDHQMECMNNF